MIIMKKLFFISLLTLIVASCHPVNEHFEASPHDLRFSKLASSWDEGVPLGNGLLGELIWQKNGTLHFSLDRSDLWDLRPMKHLQGPDFRYKWVCDQWVHNTYENVQKKFDVPYDQRPAPSKIPAGALEFNLPGHPSVTSVHLFTQQALCEVKWNNGARLLSFVEADQPVGWFRFEGMGDSVSIRLIHPPYNLKGKAAADNPVTGQDLRRLGYAKGKMIRKDHSITYDQRGWGGFHYQINVQWKTRKGVTEGCWSVSAHYPGKPQKKAKETVSKQFKRRFFMALQDHIKWWDHYWSASSVRLPDTILEKQYYLEMYKFGSAAHKDTPPISLQAVWTADNGKLPPWKGDYHHDLNTELSYWPAYKGNQLDEEEGFLNWLWQRKPIFEKYTRTYFGTDGLNMPGVTTLTGEPMGGWIQYSLGPTVAAWIGQHFYLHWRYSMDRKFLKERAYPWIKAVAVYLDQISVKGKNEKRKLPLSSSPEIHNNSREAWFDHTTNFDLALIRFTYLKAAELAGALGKEKEAGKWKDILSQWPDFTVSDTFGLLVAPGEPLRVSHRHFSHLLAIHPLGLIDWSKGKKDRQIITNSLSYLDSLGTDWWCGYSYSWLGNIKARAMDGKGAAEALRTFATCFCLPNSFHVNGDQSGTGKSKFTYRPFTLEGNFAFASGIQEMLLQSHTGLIKIFPAIPKEWKNVSFRSLRAEGAFLVSAERKTGNMVRVEVESERGGLLNLDNPFTGAAVVVNGTKIADSLLQQPVIKIEMKPGQTIVLTRKK